MAGDWIKVEDCLPDKPEVVGIADYMGIDQDAVVGKLIRLWAWAARLHSGSPTPCSDEVRPTSVGTSPALSGGLRILAAGDWLGSV